MNNTKYTNRLKATTEQLINSYKRTKNVWKTAKEFNMCGQTVHARLKRLNIIESKFFTVEEKEKIMAFYGNDKSTPKDLKRFAQELGRPAPNICRFARKLGLTSLKRKRTEVICSFISNRMKKLWKEKAHPKGMMGKKHSKEYCEQISVRTVKWWKEVSPETKRSLKNKQLKTKFLKYGTICINSEKVKVSWKQGWRIIGGLRIYCRSRWEANYARYLQYLKETNQILDWHHEPETFWFDQEKIGAYVYIPDFKVIYNKYMYEWHEVKGWYDERSINKIESFKKYYPNEKLIVIDKKWFKANQKLYSELIMEWEY